MSKNDLATQNCIFQFISFCKFQRKLSPLTIKAYSQDLKQFGKYLIQENLAFEEVHKEILKNYCENLHNLAPRSIRRKMATLKAFYSYLEFEEIIESNPFRKLRINLKVPSHLPKRLEIKQINEIFRNAKREIVKSNCAKKGVINNQDIIILQLLISSGLRVSELCNIKKKDFSNNYETLTVSGKGDKQRIIPITNGQLSKELSHHSTISTNKYFFSNRLGNRLRPPSVRRMVKRYAKAIKSNFIITPHVFRHTFASILLDQDTDIRYIQQLLGHSSIVTTQIYTSISEKRKREILNKRNPLNYIDIDQ